MTKEQLQQLKQDPVKYREYRQKVNEYRKRKLQELKTNPDKYEEYIQQRREYRNRYLNKLKENNPLKYYRQQKSLKEHISHKQKQESDRVNTYQRARRKDSNTGDKIRQYYREYMREYRKNNRNNIQEKEHLYNITGRPEKKYKGKSLYKYKINKLQEQLNTVENDYKSIIQNMQNTLDILTQDLNKQITLKSKYRKQYKKLKQDLKNCLNNN